MKSANETAVASRNPNSPVGSVLAAITVKRLGCLVRSGLAQVFGSARFQIRKELVSLPPDLIGAAVLR
jgi:hypothetical protein